MTNQSEEVSEQPGLLIEGIVDRLVLVYESDRVVAAEIVDFKVDGIEDSNLTERIEFYRPQLNAYRTAVETMLSIPADRISTRLVFVQTGQVVQVDCHGSDDRSPNAAEASAGEEDPTSQERAGPKEGSAPQACQKAGREKGG